MSENTDRVISLNYVKPEPQKEKPPININELKRRNEQLQISIRELIREYVELNGAYPTVLISNNNGFCPGEIHHIVTVTTTI